MQVSYDGAQVFACGFAVRRASGLSEPMNAVPIGPEASHDQPPLLDGLINSLRVSRQKV